MTRVIKEYGWINNMSKKLHISDYNKLDGKVKDDLGRILIAKQGPQIAWHFALHPDETNYDCDRKGYKSDKSDWHRDWQSYSQISHIEVYMRKLINGKEKCHIADLIDKDGYVVEFQHSAISSDDVKHREEFYDKMYWVIDATSSQWISHGENNILIKQKESWWENFSKPMFLDIGIGVAKVNKIYSYTTVDPNCYKHSYYYDSKLESYISFITSKFIIKSEFNLLSKHDGIGWDFKLNWKIYPHSRLPLSKVQCISPVTYEDKDFLEKFGFDKNLTNLLFPDSSDEFGCLFLFADKNLSDLFVKYNLENKSYNEKYEICNKTFYKIQENARNPILYSRVRHFYTELNNSLSEHIDFITQKLEAPLSPEGLKLLQDRSVLLTRLLTKMTNEDKKGCQIKTKLDKNKLHKNKQLEEQKKKEEDRRKWIEEEEKLRRKEEEKLKRTDQEIKKSEENQRLENFLNNIGTLNQHHVVRKKKK